MPGPENSKEKENPSAEEMNFRNAVVAKLTALQKESAQTSQYVKSAKKKQKSDSRRKAGDASSSVSGLQGLQKLGQSVYKKR